MTNNTGDARADFALAVRKWRRRRGMSQEQLAERAGLHRTYISDVERGARNLSLESIRRLAHALEVSLAALFAPPAESLGALGGTSVNSVFSLFVDILLVEDSPNDVELTLHAFKQARFANKVHVVQDGVEALDYLFCRGVYSRRRHEERPQVILLDLGLPKMSGLEVLRRLKEESRTQSIPVVVLTISQDGADVEECRRLGAATYLVKPVDFHRLSQVTPQLCLDWGLFRSPPPLSA